MVKEIQYNPFILLPYSKRPPKEVLYVLRINTSFIYGGLSSDDILNEINVHY